MRDWRAEHPRFLLHCTPTSSSWLNLVERWFRDLTVAAVRRGAFRNVPALIAAIHRYIATRNAEATPLVWTAGVWIVSWPKSNGDGSPYDRFNPNWIPKNEKVH